MDIHHSGAEGNLTLPPSNYNALRPALAIERLGAQQQYLERLEALGQAAAREVQTRHGSDLFYSSHKEHSLIPEVPRDVLDRWYEGQDASEALRLFHHYRKEVPLVSTKALLRDLETSLSGLEDQYRESLDQAVKEKRWGDARMVVSSLEELRAPRRPVEETPIVEVVEPTPSEETGVVERPPSREKSREKGPIHRAWVGAIQSLEKLVGFDKRKEVPIWWETISTPPSFTAEDIRHGAVFGSGMEMIEQVSVGIADLLKGLTGGIAASWISVPLELAWSWFWEGPEGVKNLGACKHDHGHHHHDGCNHDHGDIESTPKKAGFWEQFGDKWRARSEEVSRGGAALGGGIVSGAKRFLQGATHPVESVKFLWSLATSRDAREEHLKPLESSLAKGFARTMGVLTPVLGHKLFDGTGIILGHLAFASLGLPTWIGAMAGNVLFSMPYHVLSTSLRNRYRDIAHARELKVNAREAEERFLKISGSFDHLMN